MASEINILKSYFETKHLHTSDYWLQCCLEWVKSQYKSHTDHDLCEKVYEQWLLLDLREIEVRSLPTDVSKKKKMILQGNYAVQVMYVKDISKSNLAQLKNIRDMFKLTRSNVGQENEPKGMRMLNLYITDGVEFIHCFEYQPIDCLHINITPGIKLLLTGPLQIHNGEILLKKNNVQILGGEVEDLSVCNAAENVLARELGLPENPTPGNIDIDNLNKEENIKSGQIRSVIKSDKQEEHQNHNTNIIHKQTVERQNQLAISNPKPSTSTFQPSITEQIENVIDLTTDDEIFMVDLSVFEEEKQSHINMNEGDYDLSFEDEFIDPEMHKQLELIERENALFIQNTIKIPIHVSVAPYVYIKQLLDNKDNLTGDIFRVKAQFICVEQKLAVSSVKGWSMKFKITDGTGVITVDFLSDVLEKLVGLRVEEALLLKNKIKNNISQASNRLKQALYECKEKLISLNCLMDLKFTAQSEIPIVTCLKPVEYNDLCLLKLRLETVYNKTN